MKRVFTGSLILFCFLFFSGANLAQVKIVYTNAQGFSVGEYTGVATGQQWVFNIQGKIGSSTGTPYNVTINFTVP